jgi:sortase A
MTTSLNTGGLTPRTLARYFFLVMGISCLGIYSGVFLQRELYQAYESREFDRAADERTLHADALAESALPEKPPPSARNGAGRRRPSANVPSLPSASAVIGRLSVQRLHLSAMVREGVDGETLQIAVGHIPTTPLPGQTGNVGVAGHRDTFFRGLKDLAKNDEIQFSTLEGEFRYRVESLTVVEPNNVGVLAASADNMLTLVTCYPFSYVGNAPRRFIVRARQVSPSLAKPLVME